MKRPKLKKVLLKFMRDNSSKYSWFKKTSLYSVAEDWSPETVGRTLRELVEEGKLEVEYYNGKYAKGLAKYRTRSYQEQLFSVTIHQAP